MSERFELYSTWGCHLCEQAEQMLLAAGLAGQYRVLDIVDDEQLFERYRLLIPVVAAHNGAVTLGWPFTQQQLSDWLNQQQQDN